MSSKPTRQPARTVAFLFAWLCTTTVLADTTPLYEGPLYEGNVRRIFKTHCFQCHGEAGNVEGGLDLRLRRLILKGGESGPAINGSEPAESILLERIIQGEMPPAEVKHRPTDLEIAELQQWILGGAPGETEPPELEPSEYITATERGFWAFQRPVQVEVPLKPGGQGTIDAFLLDRLQAQGLVFEQRAERTVLIRRLYFDLLGLPPTPDEIVRFLADKSPLAYERLIDRLLASSQYGERWGRHWLDVAGYADSEGYTDDDTERPDAWRYRDYVIRAFNSNKPIDQFFVEQLAGDELVSPPYGKLRGDDLDAFIATGFLRMAPDGTTTAPDKPAAINASIAKSLEIVSSSMLGLTVACAECHDHRYDPISQKDYYRLRAIFEPAYGSQQWKTPKQRRETLYTSEDRARAAEIEQQAKLLEAARTVKQQEFIAATFEIQLAKLPEDAREAVRTAHDTAQKKRTPEQVALLKAHPSVNVTASSLYLYDRKAADELKALAKKAADIRQTKPVEEFVRALAEPAAGDGSKLPVSHLFVRGDHEQPGDRVEPAGLRILGGPSIGANDLDSRTTGRRLTYARWLTSGQHPLAARVFVNRVWMHYFGRGLVDTPADFGTLGQMPTHPELLDWLADDFARHGWDLKRLHRMLATSAAYQQSSDASGTGFGVDPENHLLWHMPIRRLEAEALRDAMLQISGQLVEQAHGPAVPVMADRAGKFVIGKENLNAGRPGAVISMMGQDLRRSIYAQVRRSRPLTVLEPFDPPIVSPNCTKRSSSANSTQALMLMNSDFVTQQAETLASRITVEAATQPEAHVELAWRLCYGRPPVAAELNDAKQYLDRTAARQLEINPESDASVRTLFALTSLCHALLSSNELLYIE